MLKNDYGVSRRVRKRNELIREEQRVELIKEIIERKILKRFEHAMHMEEERQIAKALLTRSLQK